ncbi:MAG TPA: endonuclease/exonuclease/phosphatase family protein [Vicinamibacteria bacterium]|nr:endonuclease/exonuclease/phosphatase family protein [Vicinamibacteria bacterium]
MDWLRGLGVGIVVAVGLWVVTGTALSLSRHPHWYIRGWDFPRTVVALLAVLSGALYAAFIARGRWYDLAFLAAVGLALLWQVVMIRPYTRIARRQVEDATRATPESTFRLVISNVLQDNREHDRWWQVVSREDPDLVLALEVDHTWDRVLSSRLGRSHPHQVRHVLDNCYGIALYSRLPLKAPQVAFLVQADIPSIHTRFTLRGGLDVWLHAIHPRPPEPLRGQDSAPRDAELMKVAKMIGDREPCPTVVAGDLNDVAWSHTTNLFLKESGLLDPRLGRGFYNSFDANSPIFRFPLDHVFHSRDFRLVELRRLAHVGSDHFPMSIALSHEPEAAREQAPPPATRRDEEEAEEMIDRAGQGGPARGSAADA